MTRRAFPEIASTAPYTKSGADPIETPHTQGADLAGELGRAIVLAGKLHPEPQQHDTAIQQRSPSSVEHKSGEESVPQNSLAILWYIGERQAVIAKDLVSDISGRRRRSATLLNSAIQKLIDEEYVAITPGKNNKRLRLTVHGMKLYTALKKGGAHEATFLAPSTHLENDLPSKNPLDVFTYIPVAEGEKEVDRREKIILDLVQRYKDHPHVSDKIRFFQKKTRKPVINTELDDPEYNDIASRFRHPDSTEQVALFNAINQAVDLYEALSKNNRTPTLSEVNVLVDGVASRQAMMVTNQGLVLFIVKKLPQFNSTAVAEKKISREELIQMGNSGLARAIVMFDISLGNQFSTYASWWIKQTTQREYAETHRTIRIPVHVQAELLWPVLKHQIDFLAEHGRKPTTKEVAQDLDVPEAEVIRIKRIEQVGSLQTRVDSGDGSKDSELGEFIENTEINIAGEVHERTQKEAVIKALQGASLSHEERIVILNRYHLEDECGLADEDRADGHSLKAIAKLLGVSYIDVRRLERAALGKIQKTSMLSL